jgi:hypothetical protein
MDITVFYAWQSDRPEKLNHYLIRDAAREACARITADPLNDWRVTLDSDTQGTPGMCDIPNTILEKIRNCDIFLADLTLVGRTDSDPRKVLPNANVVFELGYAARRLGFKSMIGVMNEAFGKIEGQVFDIKRRSYLKYTAANTSSKPELKAVTDKLSKDLEKIIRGTIESVVLPKRDRASAGADALDAQRAEEHLARALADQDGYVAATVQALRKEFAGLTEQYLAARQDELHPDRRKPAYWGCVVQPSVPPGGLVIPSIGACRTVLSQCQIGPAPSPLPDVSHSKEGTGQDWLGGRMYNYGLECWRLSQRAVFAMLLSAQDGDGAPTEQPSISVEDMLLRLTQTFRFASRLAAATSLAGGVDVKVRLADIGSRPLLLDRGGFGRYTFFTSEPELSNSWPCSPEELKNPDQLAVNAAFWFCERFNWQHVSEDSLTNLQQRVLREM